MADGVGMTAYLTGLTAYGAGLTAYVTILIAYGAGLTLTAYVTGFIAFVAGLAAFISCVLLDCSTQGAGPQSKQKGRKARPKGRVNKTSDKMTFGQGNETAQETVLVLTSFYLFGLQISCTSVRAAEQRQLCRRGKAGLNKWKCGGSFTSESCAFTYFVSCTILSP